MTVTARLGRRMALTVASIAVLVAGGVGVALASSAPAHRGASSYGMTHAYYRGVGAGFTYSKGYWCDTSVASAAKSGCEAGATYKKTPAKDFDPLYITVPLGFSRSMGMIDCPANLTCVDHPGVIDLSRLEPALKPLYPQLTDKQLTQALRDFRTPEHDHFITTANGGKAEWWDVKVIGVTSPTVYKDIRSHKSFAYIQHLLTTKNKNVVGPIPTNLFLYFSVQ